MKQQEEQHKNSEVSKIMKSIYIQEQVETCNQETVRRDLRINVSQGCKLKEWIAGDETEHPCLQCFVNFYQLEHLVNINSEKKL